jgi:hypothetical protein
MPPPPSPPPAAGIPSALFPSPPLAAPYPLATLAICLHGFFCGASAPVFMELAAEVWLWGWAWESGGGRGWGLGIGIGIAVGIRCMIHVYRSASFHIPILVRCRHFSLLLTSLLAGTVPLLPAAGIPPSSGGHIREPDLPGHQPCAHHRCVHAASTCDHSTSACRPWD